jgi:hypothetical protein
LGLSVPRKLRGFSPWGMLTYPCRQSHSSDPECGRLKTQSNFQSTTPLLTPTINLTQIQTSPAKAGLHHLTHL